jgi:hypothetical protein
MIDFKLKLENKLNKILNDEFSNIEYTSMAELVMVVINNYLITNELIEMTKYRRLDEDMVLNLAIAEGLIKSNWEYFVTDSLKNVINKVNVDFDKMYSTNLLTQQTISKLEYYVSQNAIYVSYFYKRNMTIDKLNYLIENYNSVLNAGYEDLKDD